MNISITLENVDIGTAEKFRTAINKNSKTIIDAFPEVSKQVNEEVVLINNKIIDTIISPARPASQRTKDFWYKVI